MTSSSTTYIYHYCVDIYPDPDVPVPEGEEDSPSMGLRTEGLLHMESPIETAEDYIRAKQALNHPPHLVMFTSLSFLGVKVAPGELH